MVASAIGVDVRGVRDGWAPYDLRTPCGIKVEVKSAAYVQSWYQAKPSAISFNTPKTRARHANSGKLDTEAKRQSDVYVFAVLAHRGKSTLDPLDVSQWEFHVLGTNVLDERKRSQHSIGLKALTALTGGPVAYSELGEAVRRAAPAAGAV